MFCAVAITFVLIFANTHIFALTMLYNFIDFYFCTCLFYYLFYYKTQDFFSYSKHQKIGFWIFSHCLGAMNGKHVQIPPVEVIILVINQHLTLSFLHLSALITTFYMPILDVREFLGNI